MMATHKENWTNLLLYVGLPLGLIAGSAMIAGALDNSWIAPSEPLSSTKLKGSFDEIETRLAAMETKGSAQESEVAALKSRVGALESTNATLGSRLTAAETKAAAQESEVATLKSQVAALESTNCPIGYTQDTGVTFTLCKKPLDGGGFDEMVKVGDFWIDRYEAANCGGNLGAVTGHDTTAVACSKTGATPQADITWFQGAQMCANAGKRMCTNAEWQTAVAGTVDPGSNPGTGGACVTDGSGPRATGLGTLCQSRFGAEDMIGNHWEWTADWYMAGPQGSATAGYYTTTAWPAGYGNDATWNVNGQAYDATAYITGLPAAGLRGGYWVSGSGAGAFALNFGHAPSSSGSVPGTIAVRCCTGR